MENSWPINANEWINRIKTAEPKSDVFHNLGEPISVRKSPNTDVVYLSDYIAGKGSIKPATYNIPPLGDCVKSFRLSQPATSATFMINGVDVTKYKNLQAGVWYDFYQDHHIAERTAPYGSDVKNIPIEVSYIQLIHCSDMHYKYTALCYYGPRDTHPI